MQWQGQLPVHRQFIDRGFLGGFDHRHRDAIGQCLFNDLGIIGIEENFQLFLVEILLVGGAGHFVNTVGIVQQHAQIADTAHTGFRADGGHTGFNPGIAENAFFGFAAFPVVVDLFVGTAADAHAPATAFFLINQYDAIFFPLVDRTTGAGCGTGRVQAVFAQAG